MAKSMNLLKLEAENSLKFRGHKKGHWYHANDINGKPTSAHCFCVYCGMVAEIDTMPLPNGIDIAGEAIALNCPES